MNTPAPATNGGITNEQVVLCPHLAIATDGSIAGFTRGSISISLQSKTLLLCDNCWTVVKARATREIIGELGAAVGSALAKK